jgi:hypothetical protein
MTKDEIINQLKMYDVKEKDWAVCIPTSFECCSVYLLKILVKKAVSIFGEDYTNIYNYSPAEEEKRILKQIISEVLTPTSINWEIIIGDGNKVESATLNQIQVMSLPDLLYIGNQIQIYSTVGVSRVIEIENDNDISIITASILECFDSYERYNY